MKTPRDPGKFKFIFCTEADRNKSTPSLPPSPEQRCVSRLFAEAMRRSDLSLIQAFE